MYNSHKLKQIYRYLYRIGFINAIYRIRFIAHPNIDLGFIHNFTDCELLEEFYDTKWLTILRYVGVTLYLLAELIYTVVVLRLFLSRVLMLSMSYEKLKERIQQRSQRRLQLKHQLNRAISTSKTTTRTDSPPEDDHCHDASIHSRTPSLFDASSRDKLQKGPKEKEMDTNYNDKHGETKIVKGIAQRMEAKRGEIFLNLAIKTTNLIIFSICTNYLILFKFGLNINTAILNIDALCNCLSVYLSYQFSSKYYEKLFGSCHKWCYGCCVRLCYCCCLPTELPEHIELEHVQSNRETSNTNTAEENGSKKTEETMAKTANHSYDGVDDKGLSSDTDNDGLSDVDIIVDNDNQHQMDDERP